MNCRRPYVTCLFFLPLVAAFCAAIGGSSLRADPNAEKSTSASAAPAGTAEAEKEKPRELTAAEVERLQLLFQTASRHMEAEEFEQANRVFDDLLSGLPHAEGGGLDANRAMIFRLKGSNLARLGQPKEAFEALEAAVEHGLWNAQSLRLDPGFGSLRSDPRFVTIVDKARRELAEMAYGLKDIHGKVIDKKDFEGKVVIVDVWGTWCPPCRMELPHFVRLQREYGDEGLDIIGLTWENSEPNEAIRTRIERFSRQQAINYRLSLLSYARLTAIDVQAFPTTFFIGRDGTIKEKFSGYKDYAALERVVKRLLNEPVPQGREKPASAAVQTQS